MANKEVGDLTQAGTIDGTELVHVVQTGNSRKASITNITDGLSLAKLDVEGQTLTGGVAVTPKDLGEATTGTVTLDLGDRPMQLLENGGAFTLAPGTVQGSILLDVVNNASAGAITVSGWTKVEGSFDTTDGNGFRCHCSLTTANGSLLQIQALQ